MYPETGGNKRQKNIGYTAEMRSLKLMSDVYGPTKMNSEMFEKFKVGNTVKEIRDY
jgi:hypothetical protein